MRFCYSAKAPDKKRERLRGQYANNLGFGRESQWLHGQPGTYLIVFSVFWRPFGKPLTCKTLPYLSLPMSTKETYLLGGSWNVRKVSSSWAKKCSSVKKAILWHTNPFTFCWCVKSMSAVFFSKKVRNFEFCHGFSCEVFSKKNHDKTQNDVLSFLWTLVHHVSRKGYHLSVSSTEHTPSRCSVRNWECFVASAQRGPGTKPRLLLCECGFPLVLSV